jgi:hypothetical protein
MSYPSKHLETLMLKKVMKNLADCLENEKFSKEEGNAQNQEEVEE